MEMVELLISFNLPLTGIIRISQGMSRNEFHNWEERRKYAKIVEHNGTQIVEHM